MTENLKTFIDKSTQPPDEGNTTNHEEYKIVSQNHCLKNDLKNAVSSFLPKKASDNSNISSSELLPFLQNLCSQVNHLRVGHNAKSQEHTSKPREGVVGVTMEEQPICSYLEKILSKNMELMEKKLMDYIDQRIYKLQEHIDDKISLLMDLLQNPNFPLAEMPLTHYDSGERLSNGERDRKECDLEANSANTKDMVFQAETAAADSYPNLEFCDECKMYADYDPLPPCFCDTYEGL